ncbi:MAG: pantoate--beta-alanine ligase, partial [Chlamydiia bacterium]|nr:pantoate--beta-alanine ligase [Chlamydiia bacterium]
FRITEKLESDRMEGAHRPGHFDGMLTVVLKLLSIVRPQRAYFGEKDYQQLQLVRDLARAFFLETEIVGCPTVREPSGLALSSRNMRLTEEQRSQTAPLLYATLKSELSLPAMLARLQGSGFEVEYLEEHEGRRFVAARLGEVRLIDNICS